MADNVLPDTRTVVVKFTPGAVTYVMQAEVFGIGMFFVQEGCGQPCFVCN
jgi:hypothetical protein